MKSTITKLENRKIFTPILVIAGILLTMAALPSPLSSIVAQQTSENSNNPAPNSGGLPYINGSISVREGIENFLEQNANVPFMTAAQTAQQQVTNGTVLAGNLGVTQGYLTYVFMAIDPANDTLYKVIVDAGNGQVLYTSEGKDIGAFGHTPFVKKGNGFGFGFGPFGHEGFAPWNSHGFRTGPW
ncbi:MAG: hypothetical protein M3162_02230, partial [Thermoproteota archaeon]|nr:hypothetical protein [Thermoproteota archaeon]